MSSESATYEWSVGMTCGGCSGAVTRIVSGIEGVSSFDVNLEAKRLRVTGTVAPDVVTEKLNKWASASKKEVRFNGAV